VSYQVFARKYRPQVFDDVLGQDHLVRTLKNAIEQRRLAHAYLFVGPRGTGKTSTARILAKALNCVHGPTVNPCGVCDACMEISQGISLDVLEIDGASNNSVDQIRELRENVRFAPIRGHYKVYIIDEVHMLTPQAFNALLKTLEEPPAHVKFVFATTEPHKVLPTILSRCQRFDLRRIPARIITKHLAFIGEREGVKITSEAAAAIAIASEGGLRDAESMLDQLVAFCGNEIREQDVLEVFGLTSEQVVIDLIGAILQRNAADVLAIVHQQSEAGKDLTKLLGDLLSFFRNLIIHQIDPGNLQEEISDLSRAALEQISGVTETSKLLRLIAQIATVEGTIKWNSNKKLHLEIALIRAMQLLDEAGIETVIDALEELRGGPKTKPAPKVFQKPLAQKRAPKPVDVEPAKVAPEASPVVPEKVEVVQPVIAALPAENGKNERDLSLDGVWRALREQVRSRRPLIVSWIEVATPLSLEAGILSVGIPSAQELAIDSLSRPNNLQFLEDQLLEILGSHGKFKIERREDPRPLEIISAPATQVDPMEEFKKDPMIQKALEIFKAQIE
jgi:DNA polymerase-3 subunit gamma/tau